MATHRYRGRVIDKTSQLGVEGCRVIAYDFATSGKAPFGLTRTDERGAFVIEVSDAAAKEHFGTATPTLFFKVSNSFGTLASTESTHRWVPFKDGVGTIEVDTSTVLSSDAGVAKYFVEGTVANLDGTLPPDITVRVLERKVSPTGITETLLASVVATGQFHVAFNAPAVALGQYGEFRVVALTGGTTEVASRIVPAVGVRTYVDLIIGGDDNSRFAGPTSYASVGARIAPHLLQEVGSIPPRDLTVAQVDVLSSQARVPAAEIQRVVDADRLADTHASVSAEAFYGLVARKLPTTSDGIFRHRIPTLLAELQAAVSARLVSPDVTSNMTTLKAGLETAALEALRTAVSDRLPLGAPVDNTPGVTTTEADEFLKRVINHTGPSQAFWAAIDVDPAFSATARTRFRFTMEASKLSGSFFPVVTRLQARVAAATLAADAKALAAYTATTWRTLIDEIPAAPRYPSDTPGADDNAKRDNYAAALARNVERRFRTAVIRSRVAAAEPTSTLTTFFTDNAAFEFESTRVGRYLFENPTALDNVPSGDRPALVTRLKNIERVFRVTEGWEDTKRAVDAGYTSATAIDAAGRERFVADMTTAGMDAAKADAAYDRACWARTAATGIRTMFDSRLEMVGTAVTPDKKTILSPAQLEAHPSIVDWTSLFGAPDQCACEHCRSVLGPAAYLADVLQLIKKVPRDPTGNARDVLFERRPDIPILALSCKNGDTALPYVDLVNEILEVKTATTTWPTNPERVDTTLTSEELLAQPEIIYPAEHITAYTTLESEVYPFNLPFHLWQEEARVYLTHLGVSRAQLLTGLKSTAALSVRHLTLERLGTTGRQLDIMTGPPASPPGPEARLYWGMTAAAWPDDPDEGLQKARVFLEKAKITFEELRELLATKYCVDNTIKLADEAPCDLELITIDGLTNDDRRHFLHRFLRLRKVLGWSITDTDRAHSALGAFDTNALTVLGGIRELERRYKLKPAELLAWYRDIGRHNAWSPSLFEQVFLNKRVIAPSDAVFLSVFEGGSPTETIGSVRAGLVAALRLGSADLALLTDPAVADQTLAVLPTVADTETVTLARLSRLYRMASFAKANRIKLKDLVLFHQLSGVVAITGDSGATASPDATFAFLELVERAAGIELSLEEIHYLLRHVAPAGSRLVLDEEDDIDVWRAELEELVKATSEETRSIVDETGAIALSLAAQLLGGSAEVDQLVKDPASFTSPTATEFVTNTLAPFLGGPGAPVTAAVAFLVGTITAPVPDADLPGRYAYLASRFQRYIATTTAVTYWFGEKFVVANDVAARLVAGRILTWSSGQPAVRAFIPGATWTAPAGSEADREALLVRAHKAFLFARKLELTSAELDALYPNGWAEQNPADDALPAIDWMLVPITRPAAGAVSAETRNRFELLLRAGELAALRSRWAAGSGPLFDVFALAGSSPPAGAVFERIAAGSGWDRSDIAAVCSSNALDIAEAAFTHAVPLLRVENALAIAKRLGVPAAMAVGWLDVEAPLPPAPGANALRIARQIREAAAAKHDDAAWSSVARPIRNAVREKQRDALAGHMLHKLGLKSTNDLYERLLIDVEMDPCTLTSRLVLAHSSCQLFVQRIQLNLEQDADLAPSEFLGGQWRWMKNYRVWEANRKVFLWPENWIEPELRDNKTPLYEEFEKALLSGPIDTAAAEDAYRTYLDGLADLSNLEIVALHVQTDENTQLQTPTKRTIIHVFGRTRKSHKYFHRKRELGHWSPWGRLDVDIQGDHLMPCTFGGRLYLFWAVFEDTERQISPPPSPQELEGTRPQFESVVRLEVSELRGRAWTPPLQSEPVRLGASPFRMNTTFLTEVQPDRIITKLLAFSLPVVTFEFFPGTQLHRHLGLSPLVDAGSPDAIAGGFGVGIITVPADPNAQFADITFPPNYLPHYQAWRAADAGLWLYLNESGTPVPDAKILDNVAVGRTRLIVDRVLEPAGERPYLVMQDSATSSFFLELRNLGPTTNQTVLNGYFDATSFNPPELDGDRVYRFDLFNHPYVNSFRHAIAARGLEGLLRPAEQADDGLQYQEVDVSTTYQPVAANFDDSLPLKLYVDFRHTSAFGVYNWELFFHIPFSVAISLTREGRYEEAQRWFHYIFDPTDGKPGQGAARYWKFKPFADNKSLAEIQDELDNLTKSVYALAILQLTSGDFDLPAAADVALQIGWWRLNPFQPHLIARMRPVTYQKAVVMRYIENLLAWGDSLFAQDTIESINEATQLYIYALNILGPKPTIIPDPDPVEVQSYKELDEESAFDAFSNALVGTEVIAPPAPSEGFRCDGREPPPTILWGSPYFCVPPNEKLLGYWDMVADRLFKIRHCMNIDGVVRTLPLFQPPIDPALLVRAAAAGVDFSSVVNDLNVAAPPYRYAVLYGKAMELAGAVSSLGSTYLSVLEKGDAETLSNLRQSHEIATQQAILETRREQVREARESLRATERSLALAQERLDYYSSREEVNDAEQQALDLGAQASILSVVANQLHSAASGAANIPNFTTGGAGAGASPVVVTTWGGANIASGLEGSAMAIEATAGAVAARGEAVGTMAGYGRRKDDWDHQAELASLEIPQIERQIEAARIRVEIASHEVAVVEKQIAQAKEVDRFLHRKFTNADLYGWMKAQLAAVYYQAYKLAFETAKRAERAFQHERGEPGQTFIQFGSWDSLKKGLLAGERLTQDLRRMDAAYVAQNRRELELTKMVSLADHAPDELVRLREAGTAELSITEDDFDRDFATHFLRRLKAATVTVPCTTGPYHGVHGTLTLLKGATRRLPGEEPQALFGAIQSVCTSQGQSDGGMFELQFKDERLLPFEGVGAHSDGGPQWRFELEQGNRFRFDSIDDLVLELRYTARKDPARELELPPTRTLKRLVRVREDFADAWQAYVEGAAAILMSLPDPSWMRGRNETAPEVTKVRVYGWWSASAPIGSLTITSPSDDHVLTLGTTPFGSEKSWSGDVAHPIASGAQLWSIAPGSPSTLKDLWIVFEYDVVPEAP